VNQKSSKLGEFFNDLNSGTMRDHFDSDPNIDVSMENPREQHDFVSGQPSTSNGVQNRTIKSISVSQPSIPSSNLTNSLHMPIKIDVSAPGTSNSNEGRFKKNKGFKLKSPEKTIHESFRAENNLEDQTFVSRQNIQVSAFEVEEPKVSLLIPVATSTVPPSKKTPNAKKDKKNKRVSEPIAQEPIQAPIADFDDNINNIDYGFENFDNQINESFEAAHLNKHKEYEVQSPQFNKSNRETEEITSPSGFPSPFMEPVFSSSQPNPFLKSKSSTMTTKVSSIAKIPSTQPITMPSEEMPLKKSRGRKPLKSVEVRSTTTTKKTKGVERPEKIKLKENEQTTKITKSRNKPKPPSKSKSDMQEFQHMAGYREYKMTIQSTDGNARFGKWPKRRRMPPLDEFSGEVQFPSNPLTNRIVFTKLSDNSNLVHKGNTNWNILILEKFQGRFMDTFSDHLLFKIHFEPNESYDPIHCVARLCFDEEDVGIEYNIESKKGIFRRREPKKGSVYIEKNETVQIVNTLNKEISVKLKIFTI